MVWEVNFYDVVRWGLFAPIYSMTYEPGAWEVSFYVVVMVRSVSFPPYTYYCIPAGGVGSRFFDVS